MGEGAIGNKDGNGNVSTSQGNQLMSCVLVSPIPSHSPPNQNKADSANCWAKQKAVPFKTYVYDGSKLIWIQQYSYGHSHRIMHCICQLYDRFQYISFKSLFFYIISIFRLRKIHLRCIFHLNDCWTISGNVLNKL